MACALLLLGVGADHVLFHLPVGDPGPYHERVRTAIAEIPREVGPWSSHDRPIPRSATELLRPNVILGRRYENRETGETADLIIVHCRDARDMGGHFPPVCYPANGWVAEAGSGERHDWIVGGLLVPSAEYAFRSSDPERPSRIVVYGFVLRPDGEVDSDLSRTRQVAEDPRRRLFGAGQVQVLMDATVSRPRREEIFQMLVGASLPAIRIILSGATR